jgi:PAS domain S-box-containing protein
MPTPLRLLLVEDNPIDAELMLYELRRAGFAPEGERVETEAAFRERLSAELDLVLSDYRMPQFSGLRALELLRERGLDVPFILVSGAIGEESAVEAMKQGAADYLLKDRLGRLGPTVTQVLAATRLRAERRRIDRELMLQGTALACAANAIAITDAEGTILRINPAFSALTGYTAAEIVGRNPRMLKSGRHSPEFYGELWRTILAGQTWRGHVINRRKDGSLFDADDTITPFRSEAGKITHFIGIMNDVTAHRAAEEALRLSHAQVRQLLDHSSVVLYAVKLEGERLRPHFMSESVTALLGFAVAETLVEGWWLSRIHPEDRERAVAALTETISWGSSRSEYRLQHKAGHYCWLDDARRLIRDAGGAPAELLSVWTDITERKRADEILREASGGALRRRRRAVRIDLSILLGATIVLCWSAFLFDWTAAFAAWLLARRIDLLDEAAVTLLFAAVGLAIFGFRRWRETESELTIGQHTQGALKLLHDELDWRVKLRTRELVEVNRTLRAEVTERRLAEATLRASEARYRSLFENMLNGVAHGRMIFEDDRPVDFVFLSANRAFETLTGLREVAGKRAGEIIPGIREADTTLLAFYGRVARTGQAERLETYVTALQQWHAISAYQAAPGEFVAVFDVVTERKRAEDALKLFRALVEKSNDAIEVVDPGTGRFVDVNEQACRALGYTREELLTLTVFEVSTAADAATFAANARRLQESGAFVFETNHRRKDGSTFPVEVSLSRVVLDREYRVAIARDVTDRRRAEAALRASEERFRQVVENIDEVFWMTDVARNEMLYVSPGYEAIWGRSCDSLYGSSVSWADSIHPEDRERVMQAARTKQTVGKYDETYRVVRPDGTLRWVHDRAFPIRDEAGTVTRVVGVAEDITERKKLEEQFLRAQRLESIGMLAAGIAHDLNNVLAPIGLASTLLRDGISKSGDLQLLDTLEKSAARGAGLVRQILGFARGVGGEPRLMQAKHLLHDIAGIAFETFPKSIVVVEDVAADLWPINANPTQIHQVVLNLCVNARDAMPAGGTLRLRGENCTLDGAAANRIAGSRPGAWAVLSVEDTGSGIPPKVLARIWEPFFTTKELDKGTGLGLSTVRGLVETHQGFVTVETEVGRGTTFRVYLPAAESTRVEAGPAAHEPVSRGRGELILLVDDEKLIRETARPVLMQAGYRVITATNGSEAATLFASRAAEIALVITDLDMPHLDGAALIRVVRTFRPTLKVLVISGHPNRDDGAKPENFASAILTKPFTADQLLHHVHRLLSPAPG